MAKIDDGEPAFPFPYDEKPNDYGPGGWTVHTGMSLRDYFAAAALTGIFLSDELARAQVNPGGRYTTAEEFAKAAYASADAMLKARKP